VVVRAKGLIVTICVVTGFLAFAGLIAIAGSGQNAQHRALDGVVGVAFLLLCVRTAMTGLRLEPMTMTVRGLTTTDRLTRAEVLGLAIQPIVRGRFRRIAVVCADGRVVPAVWTVGRATNPAWQLQAGTAASGFGSTQLQVADALTAVDRLAGVEQLPVVTTDPELSPATVSPVAPADPSARWLGWETTFVVVAFALPGFAAAVEILAQHVGGVSDLNEFDLPLPHHPAASLFILLLGYLTSALIVPIALLLLARTGQPPAALGLQRRGFRRDSTSAVGLLAGVWVLNIIVLLPLSPLLNNKHLTNTATNTHVPAYYIVYGLFVSAVTAINEEVIVNAYFMTRLSQRGWSPWRAFALSLAVRTSYHAYYGIGLIGTLPLGYLATRSFQKRQRLARPILLHFMYDAILLTIAVLTS
jgi:membrane protease YdiL (CAAX protease family)